MVAMTNRLVAVLFLIALAVSRVGAQECILADTRTDLMIDVDDTLKQGGNVDILQLGELTINLTNREAAFKQCLDKCCSIGDCDVATLSSSGGVFKCEQYRVKPIEKAMVVEHPGVTLAVIEHVGGNSGKSTQSPVSKAATTVAAAAAATKPTTTTAAAATAATTTTTTTTTTTAATTKTTTTTAAATTTGGKTTSKPVSQKPTQASNATPPPPTAAAAAKVSTPQPQSAPASSTMNPTQSPSSQTTLASHQTSTTTVPGKAAGGSTTAGPTAHTTAAGNPPAVSTTTTAANVKTTTSPALADKNGNMSATVLPVPSTSTTTGMPPVAQTTESVVKHQSTAATPANSNTANSTEAVSQPVSEEATTANGQQGVSTVPPSPGVNTAAEVLPSTTPLGNVTENVPAQQNSSAPPNLQPTTASVMNGSEIVDGGALVANTSAGPDTKYHTNWNDNENGFAPALVAALVFGMIFLATVVGLVGKRIHDSYQRRHYTKIDYLVDGMYN